MQGVFDHPSRLAINKDKNTLYYLMGISGFDGSIYKFNINGSALSSAPLVAKNFYGLGHVAYNKPVLKEVACNFSESK